MRGAVVGGSGAVNGGYFCRGLPDGLRRLGIAGLVVGRRAAALPRDRDRSGLRRSAARFGRARSRSAVSPNSTAAQHLSSMPRAKPGIAWVADLNGATRDEPLPTGIGAVPLNINGGTRVGPGGAYLQPAMDAHQSHPADQHPGRAGADRPMARAVGVECVGPDGADRSDGRSNRVVRRGNWIGTSADAVRRRPARTCCRPRASRWWPTCPSVRRVRDHPGMGAAGGLDRAARPAAAGGGADHRRRSRDQALHSRFRRDGQRTPRRSRATDPHIGVALMQPRSRGRVGVGVRRPGRAAGDRAPLRQRARRRRAADARARSWPANWPARQPKSGPVSWSTSQHLCGTAPMGRDGDAAAVVDARCRVRGVDGLWVVDGSVLPDHHQPRPARHHRHDRPPGRRVRHLKPATASSVAARSGAAGRRGPAPRWRRTPRRQRRSRTRPAATGPSTAGRHSPRAAQPAALRTHLPGDRERLGQGFQGRTSNLLGECRRGRDASALLYCGGQHRPGDGDADRGADLARRVVDRRCDPLLLVGDRAHDRRSRWRNA